MTAKHRRGRTCRRAPGDWRRRRVRPRQPRLDHPRPRAGGVLARHSELPPDRHPPEHPRAIRRSSGIIAVGLSLTLIAGHMDLSIESVMALAAMTVALIFGTGGAGGGVDARSGMAGLPGFARDRARDRHGDRRRQRLSRRPARHQRLHRHARRLHLRARRRGRAVGRALRLRPARCHARHGDRAAARRAAARLDADPRLPRLRLRR